MTEKSTMNEKRKLLARLLIVIHFDGAGGVGKKHQKNKSHFSLCNIQQASHFNETVLI